MHKHYYRTVQEDEEWQQENDMLDIREFKQQCNRCGRVESRLQLRKFKHPRVHITLNGKDYMLIEDNEPRIRYSYPFFYWVIDRLEGGMMTLRRLHGWAITKFGKL